MQKITLGIAILALIVSGTIFVEKKSLAGNAHYQKESFIEGLYGGTGRQAQIDRLGNITGVDMTLSGGDLTVTPSNTASSSVTATCFQFYATSTDTAQKWQATSTPGYMQSVFGSC